MRSQPPAGASPPAPQRQCPPMSRISAISAPPLSLYKTAIHMESSRIDWANFVKMTGRGRHLKCQRFQFWLFMNYPSCSEISFLIMGKTLLVRTFLPLIGLTKFQAFVSNIPGNHRATGSILCYKPHIALETIFGGVRSIA